MGNQNPSLYWANITDKRLYKVIKMTLDNHIKLIRKRFSNDYLEYKLNRHKILVLICLVAEKIISGQHCIKRSTQSVVDFRKCFAKFILSIALF